jgi:hypothetical protein
VQNTRRKEEIDKNVGWEMKGENITCQMQSVDTVEDLAGLNCVVWLRIGMNWLKQKISATILRHLISFEI